MALGSATNTADEPQISAATTPAWSAQAFAGQNWGVGEGIAPLAFIAERALWDAEHECTPWRQLVRREDALLWTSDAPWPWSNGVGWVHWSERDLEERVDQTLAFFRERGKPVSWVIGPSSTPRGLAEALRRRALSEHTPRPLAASLPLRSHLPVNPDIEVREVTDELDMRAALRIEFPEWGQAQHARALFERMAVLGCPARRSGSLLALVGGDPVGCAAWRVASDGRALQLVGGFVRPEFRNRHVYTTLPAARIAKARERRIDIAVMGGADPTSSGPILMRYGFDDLGVVRIFRS